LGGWSPSEYQVESVRFPLVMGVLPTASSTTALLVPFCTSSIHFSRPGGVSGGLCVRASLGISSMYLDMS
jgi:hypothetical protein